MGAGPNRFITDTDYMIKTIFPTYHIKKFSSFQDIALIESLLAISGKRNIIFKALIDSHTNYLNRNKRHGGLKSTMHHAIYCEFSI